MRKFQGIKCIECGSKNVTSIGLTATRKGKKERGRCQDCARSFYVVEAQRAQHMKMNKLAVASEDGLVSPIPVLKRHSEAIRGKENILRA